MKPAQAREPREGWKARRTPWRQPPLESWLGSPQETLEACLGPLPSVSPYHRPPAAISSVPQGWVTSAPSLKPARSQAALGVEGGSGPLGRGTRAHTSGPPTPTAVSLACRMAWLRGANELSVKNPGRLLAHQGCVTRVPCPCSSFQNKEEGRPSPPPPPWALGVGPVAGPADTGL